MRGVFKWIRALPGFRRLSSDAMLIASAYYAVGLLALFSRWYWGLALLALPFLVFSLLDLNASKNKKRALIVSAVAGALLLFGVAGALFAGGFASKETEGGAAGPPSAVAASTYAAHSPATAAAATLETSPAAPEAEQGAYVAAKGSGVFHRPDCSSALRIKPENRVPYETREEALAAGLIPCKKCKP